MKSYEEVNFNDKYIMRWIREGDKYVNRITENMMNDFKSIVEAPQTKPLSDEKIVELIPVEPPIDGAICGSVEGLLKFARAIEKAHGIS